MKIPFRKILFIWIGIFLIGCGRSGNDLEKNRPDPTSLANINEVRVTHLNLDLDVVFEQKQLRGVAELHIDNLAGTDQLILDTQDLTVHNVTLGAEEQSTSYQFGDSVRFYGTPLIIEISSTTRVVNVYYSTSPDARALQWVQPAQTAQKTNPYLYSQSQFILARSWIPCQDSPGVRMTYNATIRTDPNYLALMSAENSQEKHHDGIYHFEMPQPIPSYLMALAVGDIEFHSISNRSGIYAEPPMVENAAWEFAETEQMIQTAEGLYGPYLWGRYDMLVLPPSFPFGGMENPRLTFLTPTVLAGDRSLVALIAHELAHSWSGNLVTNATWNDFWLNEGFTVYFEHRITEALRGKQYADMLAELDYNELHEEINRLGAKNPDTALKLDLAGRDPEAAYSSIPYIKGYFFLRMLEEHFGRELWDAFLRDYFRLFEFEAITTERFVEYLTNDLMQGDEQLRERLNINEWIYQPGLPENCPVVESLELDRVESAIQSFKNGTNPEQLDTEGWTTHHWLYLLKNIPEDLTNQQILSLEEAFQFTETGNKPILKEWLVLAVKNRYEPAYPRMREFLINVGRVYLIESIYQALGQTEQGLEMATEIYREARSGYHTMTRNAIEQKLDIKEL